MAKAYSGRPVFQSLSLTISDGERVGIIGPNGSGKSTLLRILAGQLEPDEGEVSIRRLARIGYVPQDPDFPEGETVGAVLAAALESRTGAHLEDTFEQQAQINLAMGRAGFSDGNAAVAALSGGWRKRLAIARALLGQPDLLLLDEPTNHLDLEGILWLERLLQDSSFASVVVSHDRYFLENVATDMIEISRVYEDGLYRVKGNYSEFLLRREEYLEAQAKQQEALATVVRREVEWLRRGAKARTTKAKARVDEANRLVAELAETNSRLRDAGSVQIDFTASGRQTKRLITLENVTKSLGGKSLFRNLNLTLTAGQRLGLVGPNGSGKSTLLRLVQGQIAPDTGEILRAERLRIVYFDQNRAQLDPQVSLRRALCPDGDSVLFRDRPIHVAGWAKRFLFRAEQLDMPVRQLSGGERARVLIARLMLEPADLLLLDEPTNDLDIATLEVLEENLLEFPGALVLVTHDRFLLDRVSTVVLGLDGEGGAELVADYRQWEQVQEEKRQSKLPVKTVPVERTPAPASRKKLSYLEAREWEAMEDRIMEAEAALALSQKEMEAAAASGDAARLRTALSVVEQAQATVDQLYARWADLEAKIQEPAAT